MIMEHNLSADALKRNNKELLLSHLDISLRLKRIHSERGAQMQQTFAVHFIFC
jgi:hypothetical protein